jgi:hypothetical protein
LSSVVTGVVKLEGRLEYRSGGLDFHQPSAMLLENNANYSHLQRSIDTLRSLGDRLGERNVDLRLNQGLNVDRGNGLELNLSLNPDRLLQERGLERLMGQEQRMNLEHLNHLERSLNPSQERPLMDRNLNSLDRGYGHDRLADRLRVEGGGPHPPAPADMRHDINDLKYREYKAHLENLRSESSRSIEGRTDDDRGTTPSTPPTPISVGENFQEEKVYFARPRTRSPRGPPRRSFSSSPFPIRVSHLAVSADDLTC